MFNYKSGQFDVKSNQALDESILALLPSILVPANSSLLWKSFKGVAIKLTIPITENTLYKWAINQKILAFTYALYQKTFDLSSAQNQSPDIEFFFQIWSNSTCISQLIKGLYHEVIAVEYKDVPTELQKLQVHIPRRLCVQINVAGECVLCKAPLYNEKCLNLNCTQLQMPIFTNYVTNSGDIELDVKDIYTYSFTTNNADANRNKGQRGNNCKICRSCKICIRASQPCKRHFICYHDTKNKLKKLYNSMIRR